MSKVTLVPIDADNWEDACDLEVAEEQEDFVAPNWYSILESKFDEENYPMAILDDKGRMVGFLMYDWDPEYGGKKGDRRLEMSRLMIADGEQGKGYGKAAVQALLLKLRAEYPGHTIYTSVEPKNKAATKLYESLGFVKTGEVAWDETVLALAP
jgi:diamine N-acetyltransferase